MNSPYLYIILSNRNIVNYEWLKMLYKELYKTCVLKDLLIKSYILKNSIK
jgi:hypothetical protein